MRRILGFCVVLAVATPAWAQNNVPSQQPFSQQPTLSTSVPNIQAPAAATVTTPSTVAQPGMATVPAGTTYYGNTVVAQPAATTMVPAGNTTYYYYPQGNSGRMFRRISPTVYSTNPTPVYYTTVRRGLPFGLFRRRFAQPAYTTAAYTTTPTYYTTPGYTPTTYTVPAGTSPVAPVYTPHDLHRAERGSAAGHFASVGHDDRAEHNGAIGHNDCSVRVDDFTEHRAPIGHDDPRSYDPGPASAQPQVSKAGV